MLSKEVPPPLSEESLRSTKKVRIRGGADGDGGGESSIVEGDVEMAEKEVGGGISYRNKLLNQDGNGKTTQSLTEVVITKEDYRVSREESIPSVDFSSNIRDILVKGMERTLIIKLLGRFISYQDLLARTKALWQPKGSYQLLAMEGSFFFATFTREEDYTRALMGGPWMIYGAYLTVQPWTLEFDPTSAVVSKVVAWIRIPGLSFRYYHKSTLRVIGALLGEVVKIDYMTESRERGKYARIAVLIDLLQPLIPRIKVDGKAYRIEYEGLPSICFGCGKFGHTQEKCKDVIWVSKKSDNQERKDMDHNPAHVDPDSQTATGGHTAESTSSQYGAWMQVQYPRKGKKQTRGKSAEIAGSSFNGGSRYNVLFECDDLADTEAQLAQQITEPIAKSHQGHSFKDVVHKETGLEKLEARVSNMQSQSPKSIRETKSQPPREYRRKETKEAPPLSPLTKPNLLVTPLNVISALDKPVGPVSMNEDTLSPKENIVGPILMHEDDTSQRTTQDEPPQVLPEPSPGFIPVKCVSTLDPSKHTVVSLQRMRPALVEINKQISHISDLSMVLEDCRTEGVSGKENSVGITTTKKKTQQGVKLQSNSVRKLKISKKLNGKHVSRDALAILKEEIDYPKGVQVSSVASPGSDRGTQGIDEDPSGSGMTA